MADLPSGALQSQEGAALIDVQTTALFGNLRELQTQMQNAVGQDATSVEELMQKVQVIPPAHSKTHIGSLELLLLFGGDSKHVPAALMCIHAYVKLSSHGFYCSADRTLLLEVAKDCNM